METKELLKNIEFTVTNRYYASGYDDYMDKLVKEIFGDNLNNDKKSIIIACGLHALLGYKGIDCWKEIILQNFISDKKFYSK